MDVRRAGGDLDAVRHGDARHLQRRLEIGSAVVDAGQDMAVEIDQTEVFSIARITVGLVQARTDAALDRLLDLSWIKASGFRRRGAAA